MLGTTTIYLVGKDLSDRESQQMERTLVNEALHSHLTPKELHFNWDVGLELPNCWFSTLKTV